MKEIRNTTAAPLRLTLPGGKVLHLGPAKVAQVTEKALERESLKKLVESGSIEILGEGERADGVAGQAAGTEQTHARAKSPFRRKAGER